MGRLQITVNDRMERKLKLYSAYLGISKNEFIRQTLTFKLRDIEKDTIPAGIIKTVEEGVAHECK